MFSFSSHHMYVLTIFQSLFTLRYLPLGIHCSPSTIHHLQSTIRLAIHPLQFTIHSSPLTLCKFPSQCTICLAFIIHHPFFIILHFPFTLHPPPFPSTIYTRVDSAIFLKLFFFQNIFLLSTQGFWGREK